MSTAFGRAKARSLARLGLEWERGLPHDVWIVTTCRKREVFATPEDGAKALKIWDKFKGRCDALDEATYCERRHTLVKGQNEVPLATIERIATMEALHAIWHDPVMREEYKQSLEHPTLCNLPPVVVEPPTRRHAEVVYVIRAEGPKPQYKIGRSHSGRTRLNELQTGSPAPLTLVGEIRTDQASKLETILHKRYASFHQRGEWFALPMNVLRELFPLMEPA